MIRNQANFQKLSPGTVLKASVNKFPLIKHYGIVLSNEDGKVKVIHNTPNKKNEYGGNIQIDTLEDFLKTRTFEQAIKTNVSREKIVKVVGENISRDFHLIKWNSETFVWKIWKGHQYSPQILNWSKYIAGGSLIGLSFVKDKRKKRLMIFGLILIILVISYQMSKPLPKIESNAKSKNLK